MSFEILRRYTEVERKVEKAGRDLADLLALVQECRKKFQADLEGKMELVQFSQFDPDQVRPFLEEPYVIIPKKQDEWYVVAPKFVNFQIGWLERSTRSYNVFVVNKYMQWIAQVPEKIRMRFKFKKPLPLKVYDGMLLTGEMHQDEAWNRYKRYLSCREGSTRIRVKKGREFQLIAQMIDDGILPFIPQPVEKTDLRNVTPVMSLRDYQEEAWRRFLELGAVGVYWAFGTGKTFLGLHAIEKLRGNKLVVVPSRTLKEQWNNRIRKFCVNTRRWDVEVQTYHSYHKVRGKDYALVVFDECHRLPANTFSRMATIKAKYRIGLSGTPYREDGRTDYIFALTGFPLGLDWNKFLELGLIAKPTIILHLFSNYRDKLRKLDELVQLPKKTVIFCDSLDLGKRLASKHNLPFVYGATTDRLEIIEKSMQTIVSRVGDEGLSIPKIERVIEVDWLYGSRRQEAQRVGRLFHSQDKEPEHIILMTDKEFGRDEKRLFAIYEKGFRINVLR